MRPSLTKNDRRARTWIYVVSVVVFIAIALLSRVKLEVDLGFNPHLFAAVNAIINTIVALLLLAGLVAAKQRRYTTHKTIMLTAIVLSCLFLISYICHHLFAGETHFGGTGAIRYVYFVLLATHIILAAVILPFILFTAYRALIGEYAVHRKIARRTWPIWFYVSVTGPVVYLLISPYYR